MIINIEAKSDIKKNEIATKLKKHNIFPLPIEFQKKISPKASFSLCINDSDEIVYKKNIKLVSDTILKKYCNLFSINEKKVKKLNKTIYYVKEKGNIKNKIIMHLENWINENNKNWQ